MVLGQNPPREANSTGGSCSGAGLGGALRLDPGPPYRADRAGGHRALRLPEWIRIAAGSLDAHVGAVGAGIRPDDGGQYRHLHRQYAGIGGRRPGRKGPAFCVCGQAEDSILPGLVGIKTSQAAFGDLFAWLRDLLLWPVEAILMDSDRADPATRATIHRELREGLMPHLAEAAADSPLAAAPMALDWFNGRRYPRINESLQGAISGLSLGATAPDLYQALALGAVFGQKQILDSLQAPDSGLISCSWWGASRTRPPRSYSFWRMSRTSRSVFRRPSRRRLGGSLWGSVQRLRLRQPKPDTARGFREPMRRTRPGAPSGPGLSGPGRVYGGGAGGFSL